MAERSGLSRRDFLKLIGAAIGGAAVGHYLERAAERSEFSRKDSYLRKLIDEHPEDATLKGAYSAFIQAHIAILGGYGEGLSLAASNLHHYIYGEGRTRDLSHELREIAVKNYGSVEKYLAASISYAINFQENIISPPDTTNRWMQNLGIKINRDSLPEWDKLRVVVDPLDRDLVLGIGRHTLSARLDVIDIEEVDMELIGKDPIMKDATQSLRENDVNFRIQRYLVKPVGTISIFDKYYFSEDNGSNSGRGMNVGSKTLEFALKTISVLINTDNLAHYMGEDSFDLLMSGHLDIPQGSLNLLERLNVAKRFDVIGEYENVGEIPIDIIIRRN